MTPQEWEHEHARCLGMYHAGAAINDVGRRGRPIYDDDFLIAFNADAEEVPFTIPDIPGEAWRVLIDTFEAEGLGDGLLRAGQRYGLRSRSLVVLTRPMVTV
jgi:glycogen operon protein